MHRIIKERINHCSTCQRTKTNHREEIFRGITPVGRQPFECLQVDFSGEYVETTAGHRNILPVTDTFSRFTVFLAARSQTAKEAAELLVNFVFPYQGLPRSLHSDQGQAFVSDLYKALMDFFGIQLSTTCVYHPQGNARTERSHRTLHDLLKGFLMETSHEWDSCLGLISLAYNAFVNVETGWAPYMAAFGRAPVLPIDAVLPHQRKDSSIPEYVNLVQRALKKMCQELEPADDSMMIWRESLRQRRYNPGDLVLVWRTSPAPPGTKKLLPKYIGPYDVIRQVSPQVVLVNREGRGVKFHVSMTRPWKPPLDEENQEDQSAGNSVTFEPVTRTHSEKPNPTQPAASGDEPPTEDPVSPTISPASDLDMSNSQEPTSASATSVAERVQQCPRTRRAPQRFGEWIMSIFPWRM
jgi:transposase InsO family protein